MATEKTRYSRPIVCGHCKNSAPMAVTASHSQVVQYGEEDPDGHTFGWEEGPIFEILECPACKGITLARRGYHSELDPHESGLQVLYPVNDSGFDGLPPDISRALDAANKVKKIDANAYGVLIGRLLEMVCFDRNASGNSLAELVKDLALKGEIPDKLVKVVDSLRVFRNIGAHPGAGELTDAELPILTDLTRAVLEYVYRAPFLAEQAAKSIEKVRRKKGPTRPKGPK